MKLGMLMYHDEGSSEQKLQGCKQQQTASGKKDFLNGVSAYNLSSHKQTWCTDVSEWRQNVWGDS